MKKVLFVCALFSSGVIQAQSLYNQSLISISPSGVLFVKDSLVNNGTLINNGDMQIGGAWINNSQYDAGQGQITFNSEIPQVINHNDQSFSKLSITGGEKIFQANITIENELNLSEGVLISQNDAKIIFNEGATSVGGSDQSHIQGTVYHKGTGDKLFPVGNGTVYLPVEILNVQGTSAEIGIREIELNGNTLQASASLDAISTNRYWEMNVVSGDLSSSTVILPVRDEAIVQNTDFVVVAQSAGTTQNFESLGRTAFEGSSANGNVTSAQPVNLKLLAVGVAEDKGSIEVYNAVSPNEDGLNDFLRIGNIEKYPENKVSFFNRWGDVVFELTGYNNKDRVFTGMSNIGSENKLSSGTYFYVINKGDGSPVENGYIVLKN
jgi:gliding motility-associated-like protein